MSVLGGIPSALSLSKARAWKRKMCDLLLRVLCLISLVVPFSFLVYTFYGVAIHGYHALYTTTVTVEAAKRGATLAEARAHLHQQMIKLLDPPLNQSLKASDIYLLFSLSAVSRMVENSKSADYQQSLLVSASNGIDTINKGGNCPESGHLCQMFEQLQKKNAISSVFNAAIFTHGDSAEPSQAGILGVTLGSLMTIGVCLCLAIPLGILSGICMEEFMPKGKLNRIIEISISNLNTTPAIIFGILGLAFYVDFCNIPRSSPLAGGLTLAMMMIPMLIIITREAIKSVPAAIKEAALALGASKMQILFHHTLPLSIPYMATGLILSTARVMGESAPLLMIGMVAFVADNPSSVLEPATVFPTQIYIWSSNPDHGFAGLTALTIIALLIMLLVLNLIASVFRKFFARENEFD